MRREDSYEQRRTWEAFVLAAIASGRKNGPEAVILADELMNARDERFPIDPETGELKS